MLMLLALQCFYFSYNSWIMLSFSPLSASIRIAWNIFYLHYIDINILFTWACIVLHFSLNCDFYFFFVRYRSLLSCNGVHEIHHFQRSYVFGVLLTSNFKHYQITKLRWKHAQWFFFLSCRIRKNVYHNFFIAELMCACIGFIRLWVRGKTMRRNTNHLHVSCTVFNLITAFIAYFPCGTKGKTHMITNNSETANCMIFRNWWKWGLEAKNAKWCEKSDWICRKSIERTPKHKRNEKNGAEKKTENEKNIFT